MCGKKQWWECATENDWLDSAREVQTKRKVKTQITLGNDTANLRMALYLWARVGRDIGQGLTGSRNVLSLKKIRKSEAKWQTINICWIWWVTIWVSVRLFLNVLYFEKKYFKRIPIKTLQHNFATFSRIHSSSQAGLWIALQSWMTALGCQWHKSQ